MRNRNLSLLIEGAIMIALAQILSQIPTGNASYSISLGTIPIALFALRHGITKSFLVGLSYGLLKIAIGDVYWLHPAQVIIEYTIPYACIAFTGIVHKKFHIALRMDQKKRAYILIISGVVFGALTRYFWHFLAGYLYWGSYAPEGMSPLMFSFIANGTSASLTALTVSIVLIIMLSVSPRLYKPNF